MHSGEVIDLQFPLDIVHIKNKDNIIENKNKIAIGRGPFVYCLEGADNGWRVDDCRIIKNAAMKVEYKSDRLGGVYTITGKCRKAGRRETFTAIPYYAWSYRGPAPMAVWLPYE